VNDILIGKKETVGSHQPRRQILRGVPGGTSSGKR
jgi:hypothetical protein